MEPLLDRASFLQTAHVVGIRVDFKEADKLAKYLGKPRLLQIRGIRPVIKDSKDEDKRVVLLNRESFRNPEDALELIRKSDLSWFESTPVELDIEYDVQSADEVLKRLLPHDVDTPGSFETIGHVAHLNLRADHEPYKKRIGQVILDKSPNVRTVVNKIGIIENEFRTFPMEVLAGEDDMEVEVKTHGLRFQFNFAKVYWNSRLTEEHGRLIRDRFKKGDVLLDGFCGVGPFAVRAARAGCVVHANDLNPDSVASLIKNCGLNRVKVEDKRGASAQFSGTFTEEEMSRADTVMAYNGDARDFIRFAVRQPRSTDKTTHVVMNLPAIAPEFLDAFIGAVPRSLPLPHVHCYCFSAAPDQEAIEKELTERFRKALNAKSEFPIEFRKVRDVAPNKLMYCGHFVLPGDVGYSPQDGDQLDEAVSKRSKLE